MFERGRGNVCSVEFNCLYRWHATTSLEDEQWVHQVFQNLFPGKQPDEVRSCAFCSRVMALISTPLYVVEYPRFQEHGQGNAEKGT